MKFTIDRIEEKTIVCELETEEIANLPLAFLPEAKEGEIYEILPRKDEAGQQNKTVQTLVNSLFED